MDDEVTTRLEVAVWWPGQGHGTRHPCRDEGEAGRARDLLFEAGFEHVDIIATTIRRRRVTPPRPAPDAPAPGSP